MELEELAQKDLMKKLFILIITLFFFLPSFADHIAGGELFYEYISEGTYPNTKKYKITMKLFRDCSSTGQTLQGDDVKIGIYNSTNLSRVAILPLVLQLPITTNKFDNTTIPCLTQAPTVCYQIGIFTGTIDLPTIAEGYILSWIRCCRIDNIANLSISQGLGGIYVTQIPGTSAIGTGNNSSPQFASDSAALVCQNRSFTPALNFGATDADGDSLTYAFCEAYNGGTSTNPNPAPPASLALTALPYGNPFSGASPLGPSVSINPSTGKITGTAPIAGKYVINVCVTEWRNNKAINVHRKDFILQIGSCDFASADPSPSGTAWCEDFKVNFKNNNTSPSIIAYAWDFGVTDSTNDVSTEAEPVYNYPDTGSYDIKLTVKGSGGCENTAITTIRVFPGFKPAFDIIGSCFKSPFQFRDRSTTSYGQINSWRWDFGDSLTVSDISTIQNPSYKYADPGVRNAKLVVTSTKGCIDSIIQPVTVKDVALVTLPFRDTLICSIDTLRLAAEGAGIFAWSPAYNILNANTATPFVYPKDTTTYTVSFTDANGCSNVDSIKVNVINSVSVYAGADTTICRGDNININPVSVSLNYSWTPVTGLLTNPAQKNQVAVPDASTTYSVTARVGKCVANDDIRVNVVPYPGANAGTDVSICYGTSTQLTGTIIGASYTWSPANTLQSPASLTPLAAPASTTAYVLTARDTIGCPKPFRDTVLVTVRPRILANAGNDTTVVANQPLQLNATGGTNYTWTPFTGMNNSAIANPVVTLGTEFSSVIYKVKVSDTDGCFAEDEVKVLVFKTGPDIFIPTAFTPNADGKNDILKPILVGIRNMQYFSIYNRWGQMIFTSSTVGVGWDGTSNGKEQATGTYVFTARGTDYLGKTVFKKGTVVLIR